MVWSLDVISEISYWPVVLAVLANFILGFVWYAPSVFGKQWMKAVGLKAKDMKDNKDMGTTYMAMLVFSFLSNSTLAIMMMLMGVTAAFYCLLTGLIIGFFFTFAYMLNTNAFEKRSFEVTMINGGYVMVALAISGWIIAIV